MMIISEKKYSTNTEAGSMEKTYTERGIRATAKELLKSDTDTLPVKDWGDGNTLFVSLKKESIFATGVITVDTKKIFVGSKKK